MSRDGSKRPEHYPPWDRNPRHDDCLMLPELEPGSYIVRRSSECRYLEPERLLLDSWPFFDQGYWKIWVVFGPLYPGDGLHDTVLNLVDMGIVPGGDTGWHPTNYTTAD